MGKFRLFGLSLFAALMVIGCGGDANSSEGNDANSKDAKIAKKFKEQDVAWVKEIKADFTDSITDDEKIKILKKHCDKGNYLACSALLNKSEADDAYVEKYLNINLKRCEKRVSYCSSGLTEARKAKSSEYENKIASALEKHCKNGSSNACLTILKNGGEGREDIANNYLENLLKECKTSGNDPCKADIEATKATNEYYNKLMPIATEVCDTKNDPFACMAVSKMYDEALGVDMNQEKAKEYVAKAAKFAIDGCENNKNSIFMPYFGSSDNRACQFINTGTYSGNISEFASVDEFEIYKKGCENNVSSACWRAGFHVADNQDEAIKYFDKGCVELSDPFACLFGLDEVENKNDKERYRDKMCEIDPLSCID